MQESNRGCLIDACSLLNLYASRHIQEILQTLPFAFAIAKKVFEEAIYIRRGGSGEDADERDPIDLSPLQTANLLEIISPESEEEQAAYVAFATRLDDGEAMTCALALQRGDDIVTDDKKAIRILQNEAPHIRCHSTLPLIKKWAEISGITDQMLKPILIDVRKRARYSPPRSHPLCEWWERIMNL